MARIDPPFLVPPATLHTAEPPPPYAPAPDRWDVYDYESNAQPHETHEEFRLRSLYAAQHWAQMDEQRAPPVSAAAAPVRGRGRPVVYPVIPGETPAERRARLTRERHARTKGAQATVRLTRAQLLALMDYVLQQRDGTGNDHTEAELNTALASLSR